MMTELFNSKTAPIPQIRPDLDIIPINENGDSYLYFHDMRGYATPDFALNRSVGRLLSLIDGRKSIQDLDSHLGNGTSTDQLLQFVRFLDENRLLYSSHFQQHATHVEQKYEESTIHHSVTAGHSYPSGPEELNTFLGDAFSKYGSSKNEYLTKPIKALYAPHIDPRVGLKTYAESFYVLRKMKPKRVIILATSHYAGLYADTYQHKPFIVSRKDIEMPLGRVPADRAAIDQLMKKAGPMGLSDQDRAHRIEHSIELHLLFLQYIWQHTFSIVPIVVAGFDDLFYMENGHLSQQIGSFSTQLRKQFSDDDETFFLISGDLAHVGKKFGDNAPAETFKNDVERFDKQFLETGQKGSPEEMLALMKQHHDPYRICGFPPLYAFLKTFPHLQGQLLSYDRWDETERESAVTFGSILYSTS